MPRAAPFEAHTERYEDWFSVHEDAYRSELSALRRLHPTPGLGLAIGVGTGRFAGPLSVDVGLDPSVTMLERARQRGIDVVRGVAESLPFEDSTFDTALSVTTICFVDDLSQTLVEAERVLAPDGALVLGYVDRESPLGQKYQATKDQNPFYRDATFVSTAELLGELEAAGFAEFEFVQTIYHPLEAIDGLEPIEDGYGEGSFVALRARR